MTKFKPMDQRSCPLYDAAIEQILVRLRIYFKKFSYAPSFFKARGCWGYRVQIQSDIASLLWYNTKLKSTIKERGSGQIKGRIISKEKKKKKKERRRGKIRRRKEKKKRKEKEKKGGREEEKEGRRFI